MKVFDLLEHVRETILDDQLVEDFPEDNLWSNKELLRYLNEAQEQACIRAELLEDDTTENLCVFAGHTSGVIALDQRVLYVKSVRWEGKELTEVSRDQVEHTPNWRTLTGTPGFWFPEIDKVRLIYAPETAGEAVLEVCRLPLNPITDINKSSIEIAVDQHLSLGHWIAHRAYLKQDSETYDPNKSKRHYDLFEAVFGPPKSIRDIRDRRSVGRPRVNFRNIMTS